MNLVRAHTNSSESGTVLEEKQSRFILNQLFSLEKGGHFEKPCISVRSVNGAYNQLSATQVTNNYHLQHVGN